MDETFIKKQLITLRTEIESLRRAARDDQKPIMLDQQSVGRLSRMDSLQVQAMAQAEDVRRAQQLRRIDGALTRLEAGEYGDCVLCAEKIAAARLNTDPATPFCISCAS